MPARILFASQIAATQASDLWSYNPYSSAAAVDLGVVVAAGSEVVSLGNTALFVGQDPGSGNEALYVTDGTRSGTSELALPTNVSSGAVVSVLDVQDAGGVAAISGITANGAQNLWLSNGAVGGTLLAITGTDADNIYVTGSTGYFADNPAPVTGSNEGVQGFARYDVATTTSAVLTSPATNVLPDGITSLSNGEIVFRASQTIGSQSGETLWISDGTIAGTQRLAVAGLTGGPAAITLTLDTPAQTTPNAAIVMSGTYTGDPQALDYNFGAGWIEASAVSFSNGVFSFTATAGVAAGSYEPEIRDHNAPSVTATSGIFTASSWTPETLTTSPGAIAVFEFNANDAADIVFGQNGAVSRVLNAVDPSEYLTAQAATGGNPVVVTRNSGADGARTLLQFDATTESSNLYDPSTNWLTAGGVSGTAGSALVDLANSANLAASGAFTTVIAVKIDKTYSYEAGPIWGSLASPGPLQYVQLRINEGSGKQGANLTDSNGLGVSAQGTVTAGWHVMTMIKSGNVLSYRLDGTLVQSSTVTSTDSFTASDFMIGGGFPALGSLSAGKENGVPPSDVGEFQAYSGVLAGTDLANAEALAANSIGVTLVPGSVTTVPAAPVPTTTASALSPLITLGNRVVFTAADAFGDTGLWASNGTAAATTELSRSGTAAILTDANSLVQLAGQVLFGATDGNGVHGLWRTDGTQEGTSLVSLLGGPPATGTAPSGLFTFGDVVVFAANDAQGVRTLWTSDGTAGGTHELLPAGAAAAGLSPAGFSLYYDQLVFTGTDAQGRVGLWMSDGTAAGTHEVSSSSAATALAGSLEATVGTGHQVQLGATPTLYDAQDGDTVIGGGGAATVYAGSGAVLLEAARGPLWFIGGSAASTVSGGSGSVSVIGGAGGGVFTGGAAGGNVLVAGGGNTSLTGGGDGDALFGSAGGDDVMAAAMGRESLIGGSGNTTITGGATAGAVIFTGGASTVTGGAAGGDTIVGGAGSLSVNLHGDALFAGSGATSVNGGARGADSIIGGSSSLTVTGHGDNMLVVGGSGPATVTSGNGANLIFAGPGSLTLNEGGGPGTLVVGSGSAQITESTGSMTYDLVKGAAGGTVVIAGYRPASDHIMLYGYGTEAPLIRAAGASSVLSLTDGTNITLTGITDPAKILIG